MRYARIIDDAIAEIIALPDGVELADLHPDLASALVPCPEDNVVEGWVSEDGGKHFEPPQPVSFDVRESASRLVQAASASCESIMGQIASNETQRLAYLSAATLVWANGGNAPTAEPSKTIFGQYGEGIGISDPKELAKAVIAVSLGSMQLVGVLSALKVTASRAKSLNGLSGALTSFEDALTEVMSNLNAAGLTNLVKAPPAIAIPGLNS